MIAIYTMRQGFGPDLTFIQPDFSDASSMAINRVIFTFVSGFSIKTMMYVFPFMIIFYYLGLELIDMNKRINDIANVCFVCGLTKDEFSKAGLDFYHHLTVEHDPWKYLYYMYY